MKDNLVDYVFEHSKLGFLSDLRYCSDRTVYDVVEKITSDDFSLEAWEKLYLYLFGENVTVDSQDEAKQLVLKGIASSINGA